MKMKTTILTSGAFGLLFVIFGGISSGYALKSCALLAFAGVLFGLVAAPEISPKDFKHPVAWQMFFCAAGFLVVAFILSSPPMGYALAVLLGIIAGYTAPGWIKHVNFP